MQIRIKEKHWKAANAEALRRRVETGAYVNWSDIIHECLEKHLPKGE